MFLWRACWHIGVADSQALAQAGLLRFDQHSQQYVAEEHATAVSIVHVLYMFCTPPSLNISCDGSARMGE